MVMTAKEMYRKTMISSKAKELMDDVMKKIMKQVLMVILYYVWQLTTGTKTTTKSYRQYGMN